MKQWQHDRENPDAVKERNKRLAEVNKPAQKMLVSAVAHMHNITDIESILAPPVKRDNGSKHT